MTLYIPPHFRNEDRGELLDFMRAHAFATLVSSSDAGVAVSHVPLLAEEHGGKILLRGHVARANAQGESLEGAREVLAIFHGPHAYVSPTWYTNHPAVPTWNYAVVHAHGNAHLTGPDELHEIVTELSGKYEAGNNPPWRFSEQPAAYAESMLGMIVGFEIEVERLEAKFKLSQNRPADAPRVIERLEASGERELAALMRQHAPVPKGKITA
ncbi:MAG TPA: FMN-binding negative transcriptional regulator [Usitatibacter sp.]|nr:FMN-binding negative transcriptional regulator [Usitatibacter sp.]